MPATGAVRLSRQNLGGLSPSVRVPGYDRTRIVPNIVHIGVGGFHRAHQAVYLDDLLRARARRCGPDPRALLEIRELFGDLLPGNQRFLDCAGEALRNLYERGAEVALDLLLQSGPRHPQGPGRAERPA